MQHDDTLVLAIDGQALAGDRPTGLGRVARAATAALSLRDDLRLLPLMPPNPQGFERAWERFVWEQATLPCKAKDQGADVLYSPAFGCPRLSTVPRILMVHDLIPRLARWETGRASWYWSRYLPESATWAQAIVTNSQQTRLDLCRAVPVDPAQVFVNPLGVPWDSSAPPDPVAMQLWEDRCPFERYVLFVGSLVPRKSPDTLLEALAILRERGLTVPAVFVGEGEPYRWELQALATRLGLSDQLHWTAFVDDDELLRAIYTQAELLISPSLAEGFNLPLIEAASCGTPAIASDLPVHREVLAGTGHLVEAGNAAALAAGIERCWRDDALRLKSSADAQALAKRLTWTAHAAGLAHLAHCLAERTALPSAQDFAALRQQPLSATA